MVFIWRLLQIFLCRHYDATPGSSCCWFGNIFFFIFHIHLHCSCWFWFIFFHHLYCFECKYPKRGEGEGELMPERHEIKSNAENITTFHSGYCGVSFFFFIFKYNLICNIFYFCIRLPCYWCYRFANVQIWCGMYSYCQQWISILILLLLFFFPSNDVNIDKKSFWKPEVCVCVGRHVV